MKRTILLALTFFLIAPLFAEFNTSVVIQEGGDEVLRAKAEKTLTEVLNACNRVRETQAGLKGVEEFFAPGAFAAFRQLVSETRMFANEPEYSAHLITTTSGDYEVRNIKSAGCLR